MKIVDDPKVSIITPSYNDEKHIEETIKTVMAQSYANWELIIVDDCSTDGTCKIIEKCQAVDSRIYLKKLNTNSGAAVARNIALEKATGRFIAYLDADDLWNRDKLEKQIWFMLTKDIGFSCVSYGVIDESGKFLGKTVEMKDQLNYVGFLTNNLIQTVGVMFDTTKVDKELLSMPLIRRRQDAATWLQVLRSGEICFGISESLAMYRRTKNSLSSNKLKAALGVWNLYRQIEHLNLIFSVYCFSRYAVLAVWKRIYIRRDPS